MAPDLLRHAVIKVPAACARDDYEMVPELWLSNIHSSYSPASIRGLQSLLLTVKQIHIM